MPIFRGGRLVYRSPGIKEMRARCAKELSLMWDKVMRFETPYNYYVDLSQKLWDIKQERLTRAGR